MKKVTLFFITLVSACLLQACHGNKNGDTDDDTTNEVIDTTKHISIIVGKDDIKFVTTIAYGCLAEIKIGTLAKQKGLDKRIKNMGAMMIKDLTKGQGRLMALAKTKKIALPDTLDAEDQKSIADLAKKTGKEFDIAYLNKIKVDYKKALDLFQNTAKPGFDPEIKGFAAKNIMTIQRHLDLIDAVHGSMR
jgi:putative membrane protein